jgi:hypothetical protein
MPLPTLDYPITKRFPPRFSLIIVIAGVFWTAFITIAIVGAEGYEYVPQYSTTFNISEPLWYERRFKWIPITQALCASAVSMRGGKRAGLGTEPVPIVKPYISRNHEGFKKE